MGLKSKWLAMSFQSFNPSILREYDIRGIVGETLFDDDAHMLGITFGSCLIKAGGNSVSVGYDGRLTSPKLTEALIDGLISCGLKVFNIGLGPTPMLSFSTHHLSSDAGIMVTGSHNPKTYNGFKLSLKGKPFYGSDILSLAALAESGHFISGKGVLEEVDLQEDYLNRLTRDFSNLSSRAIAWDPGNGATAIILNRLCEIIPGHHHIINGCIDGNFPNHHPDPTIPENLNQLIGSVQDNSCELGFGFDGDGDRIGVVDSKGRIIYADQLMMFFAREVLNSHPGGAIIADVKSSQALFDEIERLNGTPIMCGTGHSRIKSKMIEMSSPLAGEMSGHIFFNDRYYGFDDALYASLRLLAFMDVTDTPLDQLYDGLPVLFNTPEIRFPCPEEIKFNVVEQLSKNLDAATMEISRIDGIRVKTNDGWWLLRASNTQDALVARCESDNEIGLKRLKEELVMNLSAFGLSLRNNITD